MGHVVGGDELAGLGLGVLQSKFDAMQIFGYVSGAVHAAAGGQQPDRTLVRLHADAEEDGYRQPKTDSDNDSVARHFHSSASQCRAAAVKSNRLVFVLNQHFERLSHGGMDELVDGVPLGTRLAGVPRDNVGNFGSADV